MAFLPTSGTRARGPRPIMLDMTPLVDLAFLLLSFFILTTTIRRMQALELLYPSGPGKAADVVTVLLTGRDGVYGYAGPFRPDSTQLRRLGPDQVHALVTAADARRSTWVIKPHRTAKYVAVIDVMDEIMAAGITTYAIRDSLDTAERLALDALH